MDVAHNGDAPDRDAAEPAAPAEGVESGTGDATAGNGDAAKHQTPLPAMLEEQELKAVIEAMLFVSHEPLSLDRLAMALGEVSKAEVEEALRRLETAYEQPGRGLQLVRVAGGHRIMTRPDYAPWIKRLEKVKAAPKLSRSALETLAIVAYKQPIVRGEIEQIRGVETSGVLRTLLERKLVRIVGRKEVPGRPIMYATTKSFLEHFGLHGLSDLPPLREFKELGESEQAALPVGDDPLVIDASMEGEDTGQADADSRGGSDDPGDTIEECEISSQKS